jgi:addiction module HigA family antidote
LRNLVALRIYNPPHPGEVLREWLGDLTVTEARDALQVSRVTLSKILNGKVGISADMALRLSQWLGTSPDFWLGMQNQYGLWQLRHFTGRKSGGIRPRQVIRSNESPITLSNHESPLARNQPMKPSILLTATLLVALAGCGNKLTVENYGKIAIGMPYDEVIGLIGKPDACDDAMGFRSCAWGNEARSVHVQFAGGKVLLFSSSNLK